ncbi:hypothetical protein HYPSUDRAFT_79385 [Hypholoma sublateritium FD-334 SS-4]|uniref:F-box domain-containing protein n=1 Tax=Hypholoma sublateritium (strain FD-334 SS-4) TaxID=945553 RepID=A0A0D2KTM0_HYPSF|nr:hypothetical protein HYPSUDRAFT_79385 [Hypholoma sublateritium FD-334 SS-4]
MGSAGIPTSSDSKSRSFESSAAQAKPRQFYVLVPQRKQHPVARRERPAVHNLPDDLLLRIFIFNALYNPNDFVGYRPSKDARRCSQVCRRWRYCSLAAPLLWATSLDLSDPILWLREVIFRTGSCPVDVVAPSPFPLLSKRIFNRPLSLFKLQVTSSDLKYDEQNMVLAMMLFCRSRSFYLSLRNEMCEEELDLPGIAAGVIEMLQTPAPDLRTLCLKLPVPVWDSMSTRLFGAFSSIRHLGLCALSNKVSVTILWLGILRRMESLESLELHYHIYSTRDTVLADPCDVQRVDMLNLQYLRLHGDNQMCNLILQKLWLRPDLDLQVEIADGTDGRYFDALMDDINYKLETLNGVSTQRGFKIDCTSNIFSISTVPVNALSVGKLSVEWLTDDDGHYRQIFDKAVLIMQTACPTITYMQLHVGLYNVALRDPHWASLLQHFPKIQLLSIIEYRTLLRLLPLITYGPADFNSLLLPEIMTLEIAYFEKDDRRRKHELFTYRAREDFLLDFLQWRPTIKKIKLRECFDFPRHLFPNYIVEGDNIGIDSRNMKKIGL